MSALPETPSHPDDPGLPLPPALTSWRATVPSPDDGPLAPPFTGPRGRFAVLRLGAAVPATTEAAPLPVVPDPARTHAADVAARLERLAADLRRFGFDALLEPRPNHESIDVIIAALIAGYLSRR